MRKKIFFSLGGLIILIIIGILFFFPKKIEHDMKNLPEAKVITKQNDGKSINLKVGDTIELQLEGAGATGYWWYPDNLDTNHLELVSEETKPISADNNLTGAPVLGVWKFKAKDAGSTEIRMDYYRVWEGAGSAIDHFSVKLNIK